MNVMDEVIHWILNLIVVPIALVCLVVYFILDNLRYYTHTGLVHVYNYYKKSMGLGPRPPGPRPYPVVGNLLQMDLERPHISLIEWSKQYGPVFTVWFGFKKVVVLAGYKVVKEALVEHAAVFEDRAIPPLVKETLKKNCHGVIWANNEPWKRIRTFAKFNLRDFGMEMQTCEEKIRDEAKYLCDVFRNFEGNPFETKNPLHYAVSNIICTLAYGRRFEYDDEDYKTMVNILIRDVQLLESPSIQIYNLFPWFGCLVPNRIEFRRMKKVFRNLHLKILKPMRETLNPDMCRGFVDDFMLTLEKEKDNPNTVFTEENLLQTVLQLFAAGSDTIATTLRWGLFFMAKYPQIQDQVREEIFSVIGAREVKAEDRKDLPFTEAVIHETQRFGNIRPLSLPYKTSQDIIFQRLYIRKGTTVLPILASVLYDETQWENPYSFYPPHFLDEDGKFVKKDAFIPFSAGRRICLGEGLARMELFIFFVTLMQRFRFTPPPGVTEEELDLTPGAGLTPTPAPHQLCAVPCSAFGKNLVNQ